MSRYLLLKQRQKRRREVQEKVAEELNTSFSPSKGLEPPTSPSRGRPWANLPSQTLPSQRKGLASTKKPILPVDAEPASANDSYLSRTGRGRSSARSKSRGRRVEDSSRVSKYDVLLEQYFAASPTTLHSPSKDRRAKSRGPSRDWLSDWPNVVGTERLNAGRPIDLPRRRSKSPILDYKHEYDLHHREASFFQARETRLSQPGYRTRLASPHKSYLEELFVGSPGQGRRGGPSTRGEMQGR
jgi:hypothetical protein